MTEVNHDTKSVHFVDYLLAESAHSAVSTRASGTVADGIVTVVAQCDISNTALCKVFYVCNVILNGQSVLYSKHDTLASLRFIQIEVVRCPSDRNVGFLTLNDSFYLVEYAVSILLWRHAFRDFAGLRVLRQIGNHRHCIVSPVIHFVQIIKDSRISLFEMNALGKEHWCVTMAVKGQHMTVQAFCFAEFCTAFRKPLEEFQPLFFEPFGMPLHADNCLLLTTFHGLNDAIGCSCGDMELLSAFSYSLMMERVDESARAIESCQHAVFLYGDAVCRLFALSVLSVFQRCFDVLCQPSA